MFIAIDGTGPEWFSRTPGDEGVYDKDNKDSFCHRAYLKSREKNKKYFRGPTTLGGESSAIAAQVTSQVKFWYEAGDRRICLVGHSRGGHIALLAAGRLGMEANCNAKLLGLRIAVVGLFDAVDRDAKTDSGLISGNVDFVFHARRSPAIGSRSIFGQTGTRYHTGTIYEERFFACTHAGIGGTPWTGDHPAGLVSSGRLPDDINELLARHPERAKNTFDNANKMINPSGLGIDMRLSETQDNDNSRQVWSWMAAKLQVHGFL